MEIENEIHLLSYTVGHSQTPPVRLNTGKQHDIDTEVALQPLRSENSDLRRCISNLLVEMYCNLIDSLLVVHVDRQLKLSHGCIFHKELESKCLVFCNNFEQFSNIIGLFAI